MHLFIVHQFPDYDNFVPITVNLKKNIDSNFSIMNIFPVHNLKFYGFDSLFIWRIFVRESSCLSRKLCLEYLALL